MFSWLSSLSVVNTTLLVGGAALVASPILIHLLSRRKFRTVHWAAMDFLLTADKKNRRRVQLENLLLMLLRCLIILLIALLVSRLFRSSSDMTLFVGGEGIERVVILDDSPSMAVGEAFEHARTRLIQFVNGLAKDRSRDLITVYVTSEPDKPYAGIHVHEISTPNMAKLVVSKIEGISVSTQVADLRTACQTVKDSLAQEAADKNRTVYILSDLRQRDWKAQPESALTADQLSDSIKSLADKVSELYLVDVATDEQHSNLSVVDVASTDQTLVAGVGTKIKATILNTGPTDAANVAVRLVVDDIVAPKKTVDSILVGQERTVEFPYTFRIDGPARVRVEIDGDALRADDEKFFAAQVRRATEVLLVKEDTVYDDPYNEPTFFLSRLLQPRGDFASGFAVDPVTETQLDNVDLDKYDVVCLANVPNLSETQIERLEDWVRSGGGLFVALGDSVNKQEYNQRLYKGGQGLLPVKLVDRAGLTDHTKWNYLEATKPTHPAVDIFSGDSAILARQVKIFEWWNTEAEADKVVANLTDLDRTPLLVEKAFGKGRVSVWTSSINDAWNNLPLDDEIFATVMVRNLEHIRRTRELLTTQEVGQPIQYDFDAARFNTAVRVTLPNGTQAQATDEKVDTKTEQSEKPDGVPDSEAFHSSTSNTSHNSAAGKSAAGKSAAGNSAAGNSAAGNGAEHAPATLAADQVKVPYRASFADTNARGFYELTLRGRDDQVQSVLFARNIDATEGLLARVKNEDLKQTFSDNDRIQLVPEAGNLSLDASGTRQAYWRQVLIALFVVLAVEQSLAWYFGTRR